jgi:predicted Rossmann fold flavoprotein
MAAIFAATGGGEVVVLERTADGGRKILISGGGRCNVLPSVLAPERFVSESPPHLVRRLLRSWPLAQQRDFFERDLGLQLALEADTGKLFPTSNRARDVRDRLLAHARMRGVRFQFGTTVTALASSGDGWAIRSNQGEMPARRIVIATGGLSVPTTGSDGTGLSILERLGHRVHPPYAALTPLIADPPVHAALSGISLRVRLRARGRQQSVETWGGFLFTHRGYSGPSVLDVSHVAVRDRGATIRVQWSDHDASAWDRLLASTPGSVVNAIAAHLPLRLARQLATEAGIPDDRRGPELRRAERMALVDRVTSYALPWTGDEGFRKAEVTGGGVALEEIDPATFESRRCGGLFLCGELLDAFGPIGGHNFAWAWATGRAAGRGAAAAR